MEGREKPRKTSTRELQMTGIMTPAVCLHHFQFQTYNILNAWFLLLKHIYQLQANVFE
jgi:hypothetical protein